MANGEVGIVWLLDGVTMLTRGQGESPDMVSGIHGLPSVHCQHPSLHSGQALVHQQDPSTGSGQVSGSRRCPEPFDFAQDRPVEGWAATAKARRTYMPLELALSYVALAPTSARSRRAGCPHQSVPDDRVCWCSRREWRCQSWLI